MMFDVILILLLQVPRAAALDAAQVLQSGLDFGAETAYGLTGGKCDPIDQSEAAAALAPACGRPGAITTVARELNADALDPYFDALALQHARELRCAADFAETLQTDGPNLTRVATTLKLMRAARRTWTDAVKANPAADRGMGCPLTIAELDTSEYANVGRNERCTKVIEARAALDMARVNVPLIDLAEVAQFAKTYAERATDMDDETLERELRAQYGFARAALANDARNLDVRARAESPTKFDAASRERLQKNAALVDRVVAANPRAIRPVACLAEARYGRGAAARDTALNAALLVPYVGSSLKLGAMAIKATRGAVVLRAANMIGAVPLMTLRLGAITGLTAVRTQELVRACGTPQFTLTAKVGDGCATAPSVAEYEKNSCILQAALTGLTIASLPGQEALISALTAGGRARQTVQLQIERAIAKREALRGLKQDAAIAQLPEKLRELGTQAFGAGHAVQMRGDRRVLKIHYLSFDSDQTKFLADARKAVRTGMIDEIDAGTVVGPKVLPLLLRLRQEASTAHPVILNGSIEPASLVKRVRDLRITSTEAFQAKLDQDLLARGIDSTHRLYAPVSRLMRNELFSPGEVQRFDAAFEALGAKAAARRLKVKNGTLFFRIDSSKPASEIIWSAAPIP